MDSAVHSVISSLPPDLLLAVVVVFGVIGLVSVVALALVALRPTKIKASHGGRIDYSPRAKVDVIGTRADRSRGGEG